MSKKIYIYDTTLRDGSQMQGISLSVSDKLSIAKLLDELGVDYIEGGWPGANPKDIEFFREVRELDLRAKLVAFGSTRKVSSKNCHEDIIIRGLLEAQTDTVTIVAKSWDLHVKVALRTTLEENLAIINESIEYLKEYNKEVILDLEHFFDGYRANPDYSYEIIETAHRSGADVLVLCDTNGGMLPHQIINITQDIIRKYPDIEFGMHAHNDSGVAVANSLCAIKEGINHVQGTINGYGERCGNADLVQIICNLQLKTPNTILPSSDHLKKISYISKAISEITNMSLSSQHPFVGGYAFGHKGGLHVSAMLRDSSTYEHINPATIGNISRIIVSEQAGLSNILAFAENRGIDLASIENKEYVIQEILKTIKEHEHIGYQYEQAGASLELLFLEKLNKRPNYFEVLDFRVYSILDSLSEATVRIQIGSEILHTASQGLGPGHALDQALRKALRNYYKEPLQLIKLNDFKVRVVDSHDGTAARTKVNVETISQDSQTWHTVGVSENIIQATFEAISESIEYGLYRLGV